MSKTKKFDLKSLLFIFLALAVVTAIAFMSGCKNKSTVSQSNSSSASSSTSVEKSTIKDYQTISNGDFEFSTDDNDNDDYPDNSNISWLRSNDSLATSANTSDYTSGIIDTDETAYNSIAESNAFPIISGEGENAVYFNPHTPEYYGLVKDSYVYNETMNNDDKLPTSGSKILMIHNKLKADEKRGTAQKFSSNSTISLKENSYAHISVWVMTKDLKTVQNTTSYGAYVCLNNTVSSSRNPLIVKNIDTQGKWVKINFYLEPCEFSSSSVQIILGLGQGSRKVTYEYCEGFAYFDNVCYETISKEDYISATSALDSTKSIFENNGTEMVESSKESLEINFKGFSKAILSNGDKATAYDSTKNFTSYNIGLSYNLPSVAASITTAGNVSKNNVYVHATSSFGEDSSVGINSFDAISSSLSGVNNPISNTAQTIYFIYPTGASYTQKTNNLSINDGEFVMYTFMAKVNSGINESAATVSLTDLGTSENAVEEKIDIKSNFSTTTVKENDGWVKFYVYVANKIGDGKTRNFCFNFSFGPTIAVTDPFTLPVGYALFTGFEQTVLTKEQYEIASSSHSYTANISLGKDLSSTTEIEETENYNLTASVGSEISKETLPSSSVIGYTGVVGNHSMVNGDKTAYSQTETVSGLINTKYIDNTNSYTALTNAEKSLIKTLGKIGENNYLQPLIIKNTNLTSYGYIGSSQTLTANSTTTISVKVRAVGSAKAYIYLVDADPLKGFDILSLEANNWTFDNETQTLTTLNDKVVSANYYFTVVESECSSSDGWMTVNFMITTGKDAIDYRLELWNGSRDAVNKSEGLVLFDQINVSTSTTKNELINDITAKYNDNDNSINTFDYTRTPTKVTYTDDNGKEAVKYRRYNSSTVFTQYNKGKTIIATHATIDVENELDETTKKDTTSKDENNNASLENNKNWGLQITSIIFASVLVIVLIVLVIRILFKNKFSRKAKLNKFYNKDSREETQKRIRYNKIQKAKKAALATENRTVENDDANENITNDDNTVIDEENTIQTDDNAEESVPEYDYDNMDNNIPKE